MKLQILVPLDGSDFSEHALQYACSIADHEDAVLHLVMVQVPANESRIGDRTFLDNSLLDEQRRYADRTYLGRAARDPRLKGREPVTALLAGPVAPALAEYVRACGIQLVIMSTHGRGGLKRAWMGSVADELVRTANVPILLLRPHGKSPEWNTAPTAFHNVLLPIDASEFSENAIESALALGGRSEVKYTLLHALRPPIAVAFADGIPLPLRNNADEEGADAGNHLAAVAARMRANGYQVSTALVTNADAAAAIREYASANVIDLVAMVTHGLGGWKRLALGSVTDKVLRGNSVPLLVINPLPHGVENTVHDSNWISAT